MALILPGPAIAEIRGSVGGTVFSRNRFGAYARNRSIPVNPQSVRQMSVRANMAFLAEQWRESPMTAAFRQAWEVYAASFTVPNKVGTPINLTGFNAFIMGNAAIANVDGALVTAGPTTLGLPGQDPVATVTLSAATGMGVVFDDTFVWVDEDEGYLSVELGQPQSPSINFFAGPYRFESAVNGDSTTPPTTPVADAPVTAWTLIEGQVLWCRFRIIREDGRVTTSFGAQRIVVGA